MTCKIEHIMQNMAQTSDDKMLYNNRFQYTLMTPETNVDTYSQLFKSCSDLSTSFFLFILLQKLGWYLCLFVFSLFAVFQFPLSAGIKQNFKLLSHLSFSTAEYYCMVECITADM